jgi:PleD family two-component response regulator
MLSNLGQEDDIKKAMELGANDYLIKSNFTTQEITDKIKKTLKIS